MKKLILSSCILAAILIRPEASVAGGQRAMLLWCTSVAPSLFPFLALMPVLTGAEACRAYRKLFSGVMGKVFGLPGDAAPALVIGLVAGSPGGAIAVRRIAGESGMKRRDAQRLALAVCGLSPAYLVLGVGHGLYGSSAVGWKLAGIQAAIQLFLLGVLRKARFGDDAPCGPANLQRGDGIRGAVESVLVICGYMVLFGAVSNVAASFAGLLPGTILLLLTDLPGGLALLPFLNLQMEMPAACAAIGFGGLCIAAQNLDILKEIGVRARDYLCIRALSAGIFAVAGAVLMENGKYPAGEVLNAGSNYAFSLIFACILALPGMIFLTKNLFLNKQKLEKSTPLN